MADEGDDVSAEEFARIAAQESRDLFKQLWNVETTEWPGERYELLEMFCKRHAGKFAQLDREMHQHFRDNQQLPEELDRKYDFRDRLLELINRKLPDWVVQLVITGSSVQSIATRGSDCDMVVYIPDAKPSFDDDKECSSHILHIIIKLMNDDPEINALVNSAEYIDAMIPILKMKVGAPPGSPYENMPDLEVDLSVVADEFLSGLHNSRLIAGYAMADKRFAPLQIFVKAWAGKNRVRDPIHRRFNSYAITILLIHFLQCGLRVPVLPNLQYLYPTMFAMDQNNFPHEVDFDEQFPEPITDEVYVNGVEKNSMSLAELFFFFVSYYTHISLKDNVIMVRGGMLMKRELIQVPQRWNRAEIYIQDPIDAHNPGRTVDRWCHVQPIFQDACELFLRAGEVPPRFSFPTIEDLLLLY